MKDQAFVHLSRPDPSKIDPIENWSPFGGASSGLYNKPYGGMWSVSCGTGGTLPKSKPLSR